MTEQDRGEPLGESGRGELVPAASAGSMREWALRPSSLWEASAQPQPRHGTRTARRSTSGTRTESASCEREIGVRTP
jgi:hypothetical protein